jgi:hypothetical protein
VLSRSGAPVLRQPLPLAHQVPAKRCSNEACSCAVTQAGGGVGCCFCRLTVALLCVRGIRVRPSVHRWRTDRIRDSHQHQDCCKHDTHTQVTRRQRSTCQSDLSMRVAATGVHPGDGRCSARGRKADRQCTCSSRQIWREASTSSMLMEEAAADQRRQSVAVADCSEACEGQAAQRPRHARAERLRQLWEGAQRHSGPGEQSSVTQRSCELSAASLSFGMACCVRCRCRARPSTPHSSSSSSPELRRRREAAGKPRRQTKRATEGRD